MSKQFLTWVVCQKCGMVTHKDRTKDWLVSGRVDTTGLQLVVRCPWDVSEWALRQCYEGRTKQWRKVMQKYSKIPRPPIPPALSPFPTQDR